MNLQTFHAIPNDLLSDSQGFGGFALIPPMDFQCVKKNTFFFGRQLMMQGHLTHFFLFQSQLDTADQLVGLAKQVRLRRCSERPHIAETRAGVTAS